MEHITTQMILNSIEVIATERLTDDEIDKHVIASCGNELTTRRLVDWPPEAFGIFWISQKFPSVILPTTFSAKSSSGQWHEFPFSHEPIFAESLGIAKRLYADGPTQTLETLALKSSTVATVNNALNNGTEIDGAVLSGPALIGIPADIYQTTKKTLWQRLFS